MSYYDLVAEIKKIAHHNKQTTIRERRLFHKYPELSFKEVKTTEKIVEILREIGFSEIQVGFGGTRSGVVANLSGGLGNGRTFGLRADIDALPIQEANLHLDYQSVNNGVMHACAHDGHISGLLASARILHQLKNRFAGTVRFIFQPSEELAEDSGAAAMIKDGVLNGVDAIFGIHLWSQYETGIIGYKEGCITAASDKWSIEIVGKGGHASSPYLSIDPIPVACSLVNMLQTIVSREVNPVDRVVVTAAKIQAGEAFNVIPDSCVVQGTVRAFEMATRKMVAKRTKEMAENISKAMRCTAKVDYLFGLPPTVNNKTITQMAAQVAEEIFGAEKLVKCEASMGADDMGLFLQKVPGAYFQVGSGNPAKKTDQQHHTARFNIDEDILPEVAILLSSAAMKYLSS